MKFRNLIFSSLLFGSLPVLAGPQVATITQVQGDTKLFTSPSPTLPQTGAGLTRALYEGQYYTVKEASVGDKIEKGNILRTAPNGKARVVYDNGDQFNVGPGTAYKIQWEQDTIGSKTEVALMYGKFRGIVEKGGPRSKLQLRTRSAVMGVRGTDFFVASNSADENTEVSILRGAVEVTSVKAATGEKPKMVAVKAGQSAEATASGAQVELRKTTQEDLGAIQKASQIEAPKPASLNASKEVQMQVAQLEKKAVATTIKDIKEEDPKLGAKLEKDLNTSKTTNAAEVAAIVERVNNQTIAVALQSAPKAPEKRKPYATELEDLEAGAYERYFKPVE